MDKLRFLHIPKTAGSTFSKILRNQYRGKGNFEFIGDNPLDIRRFSELSNAERESIVLFTGHAPILTGIPEADEVPVITILRDPVSRVKSFCQHVSEGKSPHLLEKYPPDSFNLDEFLSGKNSELSNLQSRMLVNYEKAGGKLLVGQLSPSELKERALDNLYNKVTCYGLQELFDESLIVISNKLGWGAPYYEYVNRKNEKRLLEFEGRHIDRIMELNSIDIELYNEAKDRFIKIINSKEYDKRELVAFRRTQVIASPLLQLYGFTRRHAVRAFRSVFNRP